MPFKLTTRRGPTVTRKAYDTLDQALEAMRAQAEEIRRSDRRAEVTAFRTYAPEDQVAGRIEISAGGPLRGRDAGVDVMGDGSVVPFRGAILRRRLAPARDESAFDAVRDALRR